MSHTVESSFETALIGLVAIMSTLRQYIALTHTLLILKPIFRTKLYRKTRFKHIISLRESIKIQAFLIICNINDFNVLHKATQRVN